jgi:hypothetical protein
MDAKPADVPTKAACLDAPEVSSQDSGAVDLVCQDSVAVAGLVFQDSVVEVVDDCRRLRQDSDARAVSAARQSFLLPGSVAKAAAGCHRPHPLAQAGSHLPPANHHQVQDEFAASAELPHSQRKKDRGHTGGTIPYAVPSTLPGLQTP